MNKIRISNRSNRDGKSKIFLIFLLSIIVVMALAYLGLKIRPDAQRTIDSTTLRIYCAAGVVKPVEDIIAKYNQRYGAKVEIVRTGGSGELAGQLKTEFETGLDGGADILISADDALLDQAHADGSIAERFALAKQKPVIAVAAASERSFDNVQQMVQTKDIKFGIASKNAAVGKMIREIAERDGFLAELEANKFADAENVMTLGQALVVGSLDAAVIWDTTVSQINQVHQAVGSTSRDLPLLKIAVLADPSDELSSNIAIGIASTTKTPTDCLRFARYLTAPETGGEPFEKYGFSFIEGDHWEEVPEIHLYCGSMFTPVLEEAVREFATREGVNIYPRWEGCGKLVASMKSINDNELFPDAYLACDVSFLDEVQDHFKTPTTISNNSIVMVARKELSGSIKEPQDLLDLDIRIGICDPTQSALGRLTKRMLTEEPFPGLYDQLENKAAVTVDVGPTLMSQLLAGGLDVAFVYRSNVLASTQSLDTLCIIDIDDRAKTSVATQPWAVSKTTNNSKLIDRFFDWINRPEIRKRFEAHGFKLVQ